MIYVILALLPPPPTYNVGSVNESKLHLMLLMLKLQHTQIPNIVSGGEGGRLLLGKSRPAPRQFSQKVLKYCFITLFTLNSNC